MFKIKLKIKKNKMTSQGKRNKFKISFILYIFI